MLTPVFARSWVGTGFAIQSGIVTSIATYKAVCYKCSYVGVAGDAARCPVCQFPFIREAGAAPEVAPNLEGIFDRVSVRIGAPPLPGVDTGPRKAQLMAEARRRRIEQRRETLRVRAETERQHRRRSRVAVGLVGVSAVVTGVVLAVLGVAPL